jgi:hypothetical protein
MEPGVRPGTSTLETTALPAPPALVALDDATAADEEVDEEDAPAEAGEGIAAEATAAGAVAASGVLESGEAEPLPVRLCGVPADGGAPAPGSGAMAYTRR